MGRQIAWRNSVLMLWSKQYDTKFLPQTFIPTWHRRGCDTYKYDIWWMGRGSIICIRVVHGVDFHTFDLDIPKTQKRSLLEMFYLNTIKQLFLFVEQLFQLEVCLTHSRLLAGIPILAVFQNLRWNSNKTPLLHCT